MLILRNLGQPTLNRALVLLSSLLLLTLTCSKTIAEISSPPRYVNAPVSSPVSIAMLTRYSDAIESSNYVSHSVWNRIGTEHWLDYDRDNPRITAQRKRYLDHKHYVLTVSERAEPFLYHIVEQLHANGMPLELAMLPFIESAFKVDAVSKHGATGLWQFISSTGKTFGLHKNWWYEGRKDFLASTDAALRYLSELNQTFDGDWLHTLAAYNAGASTVKKAIRKNRQAGKPTDYWSLRLPSETMDYIPRFLAVVSLVRAPAYYGVEFWPVEDTPFFTEISVDAKTSLQRVSAQQMVKLETLTQLNSGLLRATTPPKGTHTLLLPLDTYAGAEQTILQDSSAQSDQFSSTHRVQSGDTLSQIGRLYGVSVAALKSTNQLVNDRIRAGQQLLIPGS